MCACIYDAMDYKCRIAVLGIRFVPLPVVAALCNLICQVVWPQVPECARLSLEAVAAGMCVVIGLQSTGEANTTAQRERTGNDFDDFISVRIGLCSEIALWVSVGVK